MSRNSLQSAKTIKKKPKRIELIVRQFSYLDPFDKAIRTKNVVVYIKRTAKYCYLECDIFLCSYLHLFPVWFDRRIRDLFQSTTGRKSTSRIDVDPNWVTIYGLPIGSEEIFVETIFDAIKQQTEFVL